ncbi:hypothetical protein VNO80_08077 [Phaseolus coccineus]|uniref:Uncharacterized protein n=1 Tax=Phaseolus coccineus TaxID=3886 RepID=A0AAN9NK84_PHACN
MLSIVLLISSASAVALPQPSTTQGPYAHARLSHSLFTYSFPVTPGPKFLRLFFYSTSYPNFDRSKAFFSVKAGPYTLLQHFNASLNADSQNDPTHSNILFREYCINLQEGQKLNISPSFQPPHLSIQIPTLSSMESRLFQCPLISTTPILTWTPMDCPNLLTS